MDKQLAIPALYFFVFCVVPVLGLGAVAWDIEKSRRIGRELSRQTGETDLAPVVLTKPNKIERQ